MPLSSSRSGLTAQRPAALVGFALVASMLAMPLSDASAYVITSTDTGTTAGNPAQEVFAVTIKSDGTTGSTGSGAPTSFTENWHAVTTTTPPPGTFVDANATITVLAFTSSELKLQVAITNDSTFATARITDFGLDVDPAVTGETISGGTVFTQVDTSNFPAVMEVNVCAFSGNNCAGGGNTGLTDGNSDTFTLDLTAPAGTFTTTGNNLQVVLGDQAIKWQGNSPLSFETVGTPTPPDAPSVPEPGSLALLGTALAAFGLYRRPKSA